MRCSCKGLSSETEWPHQRKITAMLQAPYQCHPRIFSGLCTLSIIPRGIVVRRVPLLCASLCLIRLRHDLSQSGHPFRPGLGSVGNVRECLSRLQCQLSPPMRTSEKTHSLNSESPLTLLQNLHDPALTSARPPRPTFSGPEHTLILDAQTGLARGRQTSRRVDGRSRRLFLDCKEAREVGEDQLTPFGASG